MKWQEDLLIDIKTYNDTQDNLDSPNYDSNFRMPTNEFSTCNKCSLTNSFLKIRDKCNCIVEIGVHRNGEYSSTHTFLDNKNKDTIYLGIDTEDKSFLNNQDKNQYTIQTNSSNYDEIVSYLNTLGCDSIDYLFIDGWHSINQILQDWEFTNILSSHGIVGFHDVSYHPGPQRFIRSLNLSKWQIDMCCISNNDWGIGFIESVNSD